MRVLRREESRHVLRFYSAFGIVACGLAAVLFFLVASPPAQAAITWDSQLLGTVNMVPNQPLGHGTQWWFDPVNWGFAEPGSAAPYYLPPSDASDDTGATGGNATDVLINGTATPLPGGEGVVFDPGSDPFYSDVDGAGPGTDGAADLAYPEFGSYGPQTIWRLYMGRADTNSGQTITDPALLTIKGDLGVDDIYGDTRWQLGRGSGIVNVPIDATIVQKSGTVINNTGDIDLGSSDTGLAGTFGNGTWDYQGGTLEQGIGSGNRRFRLSAGGSSSAGGVGTLIMHNPDSAGHFRVREFYVASYGGGGVNNPDGVNRGVGIAEFHYENGGTRAVQVTESMFIANGLNDPESSQPTAVRSSRLRLVLDEAPVVDLSGVPLNLALFDVDSDRDATGGLTGGNAYGVTFSNADAVDPLDPSAVYNEGDIVTAMFGASTYRWQIYYTGDIRWSDPDASILDTSMYSGTGIGGMGTGTDIVLIGLDSMIVGGLTGDYNEDHVVDGADYTTWRDAVTAGLSTLPNRDNANMGLIGEADFLSWRAHYGESEGAGAGIGSAAVPEPASVVLAGLAVLGLMSFRRRS